MRNDVILFVFCGAAFLVAAAAAPYFAQAVLEFPDLIAICRAAFS